MSSSEFWDEDMRLTSVRTQQRARSAVAEENQKNLLEEIGFWRRKLPSDDFAVDSLMDSEENHRCKLPRRWAVVGNRISTLERSEKIKIGTVNWIDDRLKVRHFFDTHFPSTTDSGDETFIPWSLNYYPTKTQEGIVAFAYSCTPSVAFYDPIQQNWEIKRLEMDSLLCFCQTEGRRRMCLLDVDSVCILDLESREIVDKIAYQTDFTQLPEGENPNSFYRDLTDTNPHLIGDDGGSIVLPWTFGRRRHAVITPSTEPGEWNAIFRQKEGNGPRSCAVSVDGQCVASVSQHGSGKVSIAFDSAIGKIKSYAQTRELSFDLLRL